MPTVPIAQNRVGIASVTDAKFVPADGAGGGALEGIGRGLSQLGHAGTELSDKLDDIRINEESAAAEKSAAELRLNASQTAQQMRDNAAPGAAGHVQQSAQWWDENSKTVLDGIADKRVRTKMEVQLAGQRST